MNCFIRVIRLQSEANVQEKEEMTQSSAEHTNCLTVNSTTVRQLICSCWRPATAASHFPQMLFMTPPFCQLLNITSSLNLNSS